MKQYPILPRPKKSAFTDEILLCLLLVFSIGQITLCFSAAGQLLAPTAHVLRCDEQAFQTNAFPATPPQLYPAAKSSGFALGTTRG